MYVRDVLTYIYVSYVTLVLIFWLAGKTRYVLPISLAYVLAFSSIFAYSSLPNLIIAIFCTYFTLFAVVLCHRYENKLNVVSHILFNTTLFLFYLCLLARDVITVIACWLLASIVIAVLLARSGAIEALEACVKYVVFSCIGLALLVLGLCGLMYSIESTMLLTVSLLMFLYGFLYELGVVPLHVWLPDVYTQSDKISVAYLASFLKLFAAYALCRLLYNVDVASVSLVLAIISGVTMTLGNICALTAEREEQILAFSTVTQSGYALIALAVSNSCSKVECIPVFIYQVLATALAKYVLFTVYLVRHSRVVSFIIVTSVLSLIGIPPLIGFWPKLMLFLLALKYGYPWLAGLLVVNTALSVPYYIRLYNMYRMHTVSLLEEPYDKVCTMQALAGTAMIITCGVVLNTEMLKYILETCLEVSIY